VYCWVVAFGLLPSRAGHPAALSYAGYASDLAAAPTTISNSSGCLLLAYAAASYHVPLLTSFML
jgi:hypothetical protein